MIKLGLLGAGAAAVSGSAAWIWRDRIKHLDDRAVVSFIKSELGYLQLSIDDVQLLEFVEQYRKHYGPIQRKQWHQVRGRGVEAYKRQMDHLTTTFLLSTNFFLNGADESMPVHYMMLYHPYASPCWNPLAGTAIGAA